MPEIHQEGLDVSAEEERYLRRTFRRFALPYIVGTVALTAAAIAAFSVAPPTGGDAATAELETLVAEAASLREAIATLRTELRSSTSDATGRLEALEKGVAQLRSAVRDDDSAELASRLDHAHQRINALEGRLEKIEGGPIARSAPPREPPPTATGPQPGWPAASSSLP